MSDYRGVVPTLRGHAPEYLVELGVTAAGTAVAYVPALVFLVPFLDVVGEYLVLAVVGWSVHVAQKRVSGRRSGQSEALLVAGDVYRWQYAAVALSVGFYHVSVLTIASLGGVYVAGMLQHPVVGLLVAMAYPVFDINLGRVDWRLSPSTLLSGTFLYALARRDLLEQFPSTELYFERTLPEYLFALPETDRQFRGLAILLSTELVGTAVAVAVGVTVVFLGVPEPVLVFLAGAGLAVLVYFVRDGDSTSRGKVTDDGGADLSSSALGRLVADIWTFFETWERSSTVGYGSVILFVSLILFVNVSFLSDLVLVPVGVGPPSSVAALSEIGMMGFAVGFPFAAIAVWARLTRPSDE